MIQKIRVWLFCWISIRLQSPSRKGNSEAGLCLCIFYFAGDGQVDFEEFVALLGPKLSSAGMPDRFHGAEFDSIFWKVWRFSLKLSQLFLPIVSMVSSVWLQLYFVPLFCDSL